MLLFFWSFPLYPDSPVWPCRTRKLCLTWRGADDGCLTSPQEWRRKWSSSLPYPPSDYKTAPTKFSGHDILLPACLYFSQASYADKLFPYLSLCLSLNSLCSETEPIPYQVLRRFLPVSEMLTVWKNSLTTRLRLIIKGFNSGKPRWKTCTGQGMGKRCGISTPFPGAPPSWPLHVLTKPPGMELSLHRNDWSLDCSA